MNAVTPIETLHGVLVREGHVRIDGQSMRAVLAHYGALTDWPDFVQSWEQMPLDGYMADGGRYRYRRHATYAVTHDGAIQRQPHQPHFQSRDYNPLNGGVQRWFEPVAERIGAGQTLTTILKCCADLFGRLAPEVPRWHVELHQFRVEASGGQHGNPTPEGRHRDGVDYVLVLLIQRHNVARGVTTIYAPDGRSLGEFTLTNPCDASLLDDTRVFHGVTPVQPIDPAQPAYRDVLVVTFRAEPPAAD